GTRANDARRPRPTLRREGDRHRRALHRDQGDRGRLRAVRVEVEGGRGQIGGPLHGTSQATLAGLGGRNRGSPDVRSGRLRSQRLNLKEITMRFMVIVKATKDSEAGVLPDQKLLA